MPDFICEHCKKVFTQNARLKAHLARKRPCIETKESSKFVKPFLKWVGGKTQILEEVLALFPKEIQNYHEPFLGGGSVLLGVLSSIKHGELRISGNIYASDLNANLIALYQTIQQHPDQLLDEIHTIQEQFSRCQDTAVNRKATTLEEALTSQESYYYWIRSRFNQLPADEKTSPQASAMLLFLNKTCFRGVYREGPNGFNVPFGNYNNPGILDEAHIRQVSDLIQPVIFTARSFTDSLDSVEPGDFVYLDPPYAPETKKSFVSYTADGFTIENHTELFNRCQELDKQGVKMLMSNADVSLVKDAFQAAQYTTKIIECRRAIHSKKPDSKTNEVLITN